MSPFVQYNCGCIEGPDPAKICWRHGAPVKGPFVGAGSSRPADERGVARKIDCVKGRPIAVWITNDVCDGIGLCPKNYDDCEYKRARSKSPAQESLI